MTNTADKGITALGIFACKSKLLEPINELVASIMELEKNIQGKIPAKANKVKFSICILKTTVKTNFMAKAKRIGKITVQANPNRASAYLSLKFFLARSNKISLFLAISLNSSSINILE